MISKLYRQFSVLWSVTKDYAPVMLASVSVTLVVIGIRETKGLEFWELGTFDQMVRAQPQSEPDSRILVVGITEEDIQKQQEWPLRDRTLARLIAKLQQYQPKVIGLDLFRDIPQEPGHQELKTRLKASNIVAITQIGGNQIIPAPSGIPDNQIGFNDLALDADNVLRRNLLYIELENKSYQSFSLRLSLKYLEDKQLPFTVTNDGITIGTTNFKALNPDSGSYQMSLGATNGWQILLNYHSQNQVARQVSLTEVLNDQIKPEWVKNKIILIGTTATSGKDLFATPYSATQTENHLMSGVMIHAQSVSQILSTILDGKRLFWYWDQQTEYLWIWCWSLVGGIIAWRSNHPLILLVSEAIALGTLTGICFLIFTQAGWIPLVPSAISLLGTSAGILAYHVLYSRSHDTLTGLPDRNYLTKQIQKANKKGKDKQEQLIAILSLDLDRFKAINESFGHKVGDQFLQSTVARVKSCIRNSDHIVRIGGDEFSILLHPVVDVNEATKIADRLQYELTLPFKLKDQEIFTTVSIGIAFHPLGQELEPEDLIRNAHTAMNRAKASGKDCYEIFAKGMYTQAINRLHLENDLRQAIKRQEFQLYYQPIIDLQTKKIAGFEALVRWNSPERGFVSPGEFIPLAEETGLILPLGAWILEEACRQMNLWHQQFNFEQCLMISVNLSSRQFSQANLSEQIQKVLAATGLNPQSLKLEITEGMVMESVESVIKSLELLKALGISISIDDFGTGYSSLSYLHRFPIDTLKVDQSFVKQMSESNSDLELVKTIIMIGHNLGMDVIAEGVETEEQMQVLRSLGCECGQGYFFAKPLPSEAATALLSTAPLW